MKSFECKEFVIGAMHNAKGDDLERAEAAFRGHQLDEQYGQSGNTKGQILEEYRNHRKRWQEAFEWLTKVSI